jgi:hypothetical protein
MKMFVSPFLVTIIIKFVESKSWYVGMMIIKPVIWQRKIWGFYKPDTNHTEETSVTLYHMAQVVRLLLWANFVHSNGTSFHSQLYRNTFANEVLRGISTSQLYRNRNIHISTISKWEYPHLNYIEIGISTSQLYRNRNIHISTISK